MAEKGGHMTMSYSCLQVEIQAYTEKHSLPGAEDVGTGMERTFKWW